MTPILVAGLLGGLALVGWRVGSAGLACASAMLLAIAVVGRAALPVAWRARWAPEASAEARLLKQMVEATTDAVWAQDLEGRSLYVNPAAAKVIGHPRDEVIGRRALDMIDAKAARPIRSQIEASLGRETVEQVENTLPVAGVPRVFSSVRGPLRDERGKVVGIFGIGRDVTESRRGEEQRLRGLLEGAPDAMVGVDTKGRVLYVNGQAQRLFGYPREELLGKSIEVLVPERFHEAHVESRRRYLENPEVRPMGVGRELSARRKDGREVPVDITLSPVATPEGPLVVASVRDITERRRHELELRRSMAELESFAYVASHDLQEPLRMVVSYLELLNRRYHAKLDDEAREFIGFAVEGATRMQRLIADLLAYSRVRSDRRNPAPIDLEEPLNAAVENLRAAIQESAAEITHDALPQIVADRTEMVQLFQNLLSNALKFRGDRQPQIHVGAAERPGAWEFAVSDTGIGIAPEHLDRIFVIFHRLHSGSRYPGTGIGLAICKKIVEGKGGRIWAESVPGVGSSIHFTLPTGVET